MAQTSITLRTDPEFKAECDALFGKMGISTTDAINLFLHQAVMKQSIPFTIDTVEDPWRKVVAMLPEAGRIDEKTGHYILPKEWYNPEDDEYEKLL